MMETLKRPKTITDYRQWLQHQFEILEAFCTMGTPDFFDQMEIAEIVEEAIRLSCRFGGPVVCDEQTTTNPRAGMAIIGKLLAWAETQGQYLDSRAACNYLGISEQSLYGLVERKKLIPLRGPRRQYRFTPKQLDNYLATSSNV
jgi:excisionase family DNA binding protein